MLAHAAKAIEIADHSVVRTVFNPKRKTADRAKKMVYRRAAVIKETEMKPKKWNLLAAIHLLKMIESYCRLIVHLCPNSHRRFRSCGSCSAAFMRGEAHARTL